jgi:pSer/pThr/pTyr-binding forkhead associated (FHA) protein
MQARVDKKLFILIEGQPAREIEIGRFVIGRDSSCQLALRSSRLSRQHAAVLRDLAGAMLEDLGSSNGTWYRAERITKREVTHGDEFTLGDVKVKFEFR